MVCRRPFPPATASDSGVDGAAFAAVLARAAGSPSEVLDGAGVVILPDWRGLHPFYEELALRFAEASVHAVAVDPYGGRRACKAFRRLRL